MICLVRLRGILIPWAHFCGLQKLSDWSWFIFHFSSLSISFSFYLHMCMCVCVHLYVVTLCPVLSFECMHIACTNLRLLHNMQILLQSTFEHFCFSLTLYHNVFLACSEALRERALCLSLILQCKLHVIVLKVSSSQTVWWLLWMLIPLQHCDKRITVINKPTWQLNLKFTVNWGGKKYDIDFNMERMCSNLALHFDIVIFLKWERVSARGVISCLLVCCRLAIRLW